MNKAHIEKTKEMRHLMNKFEALRECFMEYKEYSMHYLMNS